jgi:DNA topoisomerase-3
MPKALIITEKPSVARDIVKALGGFASHDDEYWESEQFLCTYAVGHILELLEPEEIDVIYKRWTLDALPVIPEQFKLKPKKGQEKRIKIIQKLIERPDVDTLINACDAGREGELIFREIVEYTGSKKKMLRLWLQSMTGDALRNGFRRLDDGRKYDGLAAAAECRAQADWLIGMNASRALTVRLRNRAMKGAWSAGRVQTPTLALLVEKELEILRHVPEPFWQVTAEFTAPNQKYAGTWFDPEFKNDPDKPQFKADRIFDKARAEAIVAATTGRTGAARETRKPSQESPRPLFDLTSLQREANSRMGWSAARTLRSAQACYETHKVLTYPRTSSKCLPNDYVAHVEMVTRTLAGVPDYAAAANYLIQNGRKNDFKIFDDKGVSDHFAIIPTGQIAHLTGDDERLFDLVTKRFLAAFHPNAVWEQVERVTEVEGHSFGSRAKTLKVPGWRSVMGQRSDEGEGEAKGLAPLLPGESQAENVAVQTDSSTMEEDLTKPPARITEARLLSLMENAGKQVDDEDFAAALADKGLGTPATRADTIENLKMKEYVDRALRPTAKGMRLIELLRRINAGRLTSAELTGELEYHLAEVEKGNRAAGAFMEEITDYAREIVEVTRGFDYDTIYPSADPCGTCPCEKKRPVFERYWFYRCQEDPETQGTEEDCQFRIWKDKNGRYIDRTTAGELLANGRTRELDGFADRQGRTYKGLLVLNEKEVTLESTGTPTGDPQGDAPVLEVNPDPIVDCPVHPGGECKLVETPTHFACTTFLKQRDEKVKKPEGIVLPRIVCKRVMTREEAAEFALNGQTPLIEDFISRFGRPFKATLKRKPDGRHTFEFPPRAEGAGGRGRGRGRGKAAAEKNGEAEGATAGAAKPAKKSAPKKKSAAKKKVAKKASGKAAGEDSPAPKKRASRKKGASAAEGGSAE